VSAVLVRGLETVSDAAGGMQLEALLAEGRSGGVAADALEASSVAAVAE